MSRIDRINKTGALSTTVSKEIMVEGDSIPHASYMKSASAVSPVQQLNRFPDIVANYLGAKYNQALSGDGIARCISCLPLGSKDHTSESGDYGGQIIISTNDSNDYWWDSEASVWKAIGGTTISGISKSTDWAAMLTNPDVNIVFLAGTGVNDYGEWSSRQALAKGAFGSPKMFYQRTKQMIIELLDAGKTPFIITNLTAFDLTFHGKVSDYFKTGGYAAKSRQLAVEFGIPFADCGTVLAIEAALGRPDFNTRNANYKPDQYTTPAWEAIVVTINDPETGTPYVPPFTDAYRDTAGKFMLDETLDKYHDGTIGSADASRINFFANQHLNHWGHKIVADYIKMVIEEFRFGYSDFDFSAGDAQGGDGTDAFARALAIQSNFDHL